MEAISSRLWLGVVLLVPTVVHAVPLSNLVAPGGMLQVGSIVFSQFKYEIDGVDMPSAMNVAVDPIQQGSDVGLAFVAAWQDSTNDGAAQQARISFTATAVNKMIDGAKLHVVPLGLIPTALGTDGLATVDEALLIVAQGNVPTLRAFALEDNNGNQVIQQGESTRFAPRAQVPVSKTIRVDNQGGIPAVGAVEQTFHLVPDSGNGCLPLAMGLIWIIRRGQLRISQKCPSANPEPFDS